METRRYITILIIYFHQLIDAITFPFSLAGFEFPDISPSVITQKEWKITGEWVIDNELRSRIFHPYDRTNPSRIA